MYSTFLIHLFIYLSIYSSGKKSFSIWHKMTEYHFANTHRDWEWILGMRSLWINHTIMNLVGSNIDSDSNGAPEQMFQGQCKHACSGVEETQYYACVHMIIQHVMLWFNGTTLKFLNLLLLWEEISWRYVFTHTVHVTCRMFSEQTGKLSYSHLIKCWQFTHTNVILPLHMFPLW